MSEMEGEGASFELHEKFYLQNKGTHVVVQMQKSRSIYIQDRIERVPTPEIWSKMISEREFFFARTELSVHFRNL